MGNFDACHGFGAVMQEDFHWSTWCSLLVGLIILLGGTQELGENELNPVCGIHQTQGCAGQ